MNGNLRGTQYNNPHQQRQNVMQQQMYNQQMQQQINNMKSQQLTPQQVQQQRRRNLLFYSKNCKSSENLINLMNREDLLKFFQMICIDGQEEKVPQAITHMPALITSDTPKPWIGSDAFTWLQNIKYMKYQQMQDRNNKHYLYNIMKNLEAGGPKAFTDEMTGVSDTFAYKDLDVAQPKSFQEYGKENDKDNIIYTPPKEKTKLTNHDQTKMINEYKNEREKQDVDLEKNMKVSQVEQMIRSENEQILIAKKMGLL